jgi:hypothetical protein
MYLELQKFSIDFSELGGFADFCNGDFYELCNWCVLS